MALLKCLTTRGTLPSLNEGHPIVLNTATDTDGHVVLGHDFPLAKLTSSRKSWINCSTPGGSHLNGLDTEDRACVIRRHRFYPWPVRRHGWRESDGRVCPVF